MFFSGTVSEHEKGWFDRTVLSLCTTSLQKSVDILVHGIAQTHEQAPAVTSHVRLYLGVEQQACSLAGVLHAQVPGCPAMAAWRGDSSLLHTWVWPGAGTVVYAYPGMGGGGYGCAASRSTARCRAAHAPTTRLLRLTVGRRCSE